MPSRAKIAYYWKESSYQYFDYLMDWGEPSCWACGIFAGLLDVDVSDEKDFEIFKNWANHDYSQRCHIVPKAFGGCNCEANLVLLCRRCHQSSPDTRDPIHFVNWVKNKKKVFSQEIKDVMSLLNYLPEENDSKLLLMKEFKEYYRENSVIVGGSRPLSSFIACLLEFKKIHKTKYG
ncbi:HNH endonuclease [Spirosoma fluviale]|uniref:HNH endonuclease n=2 Tax=Spirosoma fluviale TaxID=1597977 RepID=A0A286FZB3_9BACT|nr:HNH endonuclease [Spirosoma fluviale]